MAQNILGLTADVSFHEASWLPGHMGKVTQGED